LDILAILVSDADLVASTPSFEGPCIQWILTLFASVDLLLQEIAISDFPAFFAAFRDEAIVQLIEVGIIDRIARFGAVSAKARALVLEALFKISRGADLRPKPFIQLFESISTSGINFGPAELTLSVSTLENVASSDDPEIVAFVLTPPPLALIAMLLASHHYSHRKHIAKVISFVGIALPDRLWALLTTESMDLLSQILPHIEDEDLELASKCVVCLASLLLFLEAQPDARRTFVDYLAGQNADELLRSVAEAERRSILTDHTRDLLKGLEFGR
jgi:hypothetical protein